LLSCGPISPAYDTTRMAYTVKLYEVAYYRTINGRDASANDPTALVRTLQQTGFFRRS
jgi:hypothetical protein